MSPTDAELDDAAAVIEGELTTRIVYVRDKALLFDDARKGFVMYGVKGRTWVALGDPVGPEDCIGDLIRIFLERSDDYGGTPVFYQVRKEKLYRYADFGLAFVKLGEDATVDLRGFTLEGGHASRLRQALRRLTKEGTSFRVLPREDVPTVLESLRAVSDDWLAEKSAAEKGFSLGFFDSEYVSRFPVGIAERGGRIVAFATLWPGPQGEISLDLMRYHHEAPKE